MKNVIVSKCGARFNHKKEVEFLHDEKPVKQFEKKTLQKSTPKKAILQFDKGELSIHPADIEDENLDGVSV